MDTGVGTGMEVGVASRTRVGMGVNVGVGAASAELPEAAGWAWLGAVLGSGVVVPPQASPTTNRAAQLTSNNHWGLPIRRNFIGEPSRCV